MPSPLSPLLGCVDRMVFALQMRKDPLNLRHHHRPMLAHRGPMRLDRLVDLQQLALYLCVAALRLTVVAVITAGGLREGRDMRVSVSGLAVCGCLAVAVRLGLCL